jgi:hypothetical protein
LFGGDEQATQTIKRFSSLTAVVLSQHATQSANFSNFGQVVRRKQINLMAAWLVENSGETNPSTPDLWSWTGWDRIVVRNTRRC